MSKLTNNNEVEIFKSKEGDFENELSIAVTNNELSPLSDIYHLFNETVSSLFKRNANFLLFSKEIDVKVLYNEAFIEGHWIQIDEDLRTIYKAFLLKEPNVNITTKHLLSALAYSDENTVHYVGKHPTRSIRAAVYRLPNFYKGKVSVSNVGGVTVVSKIEDKYNKEQLFNLITVMHYNVKFDIDIKNYPSVAVIRSLLQSYGDKYGCKFVTKVNGEKLTVAKIMLDEKGVDKRNPVIAREFLKQIPYDTEILINYSLFKDLSHCKIKTLLRNQSSGTVSFKGDKVIKYSFKLVKNSGAYDLFHLGKNIYSTSGELDRFERASINTILRPHDMTLVGTKIVKVTYE